MPVESNGGAEVNGGQLAALDEALDGAGMDVQELCRLVAS